MSAHVGPSPAGTLGRTDLGGTVIGWNLYTWKSDKPVFTGNLGSPLTCLTNASSEQRLAVHSRYSLIPELGATTESPVTVTGSVVVLMNAPNPMSAGAFSRASPVKLKSPEYSSNACPDDTEACVAVALNPKTASKMAARTRGTPTIRSQPVLPFRAEHVRQNECAVH